MQPNLWFRVIFNWASKVAWRCLGFALLRKVTDPQKLAPSSQLIRSVFKNQTGFGHPRLITREKFACFDFEFSLAIRSLSKYQTRFGYTRLRQFPRFPFEFSLAIRSVSKTKRNSVSCVWLHVSSLLVFTLSSHWLSGLFPNTKRDLVTRVWGSFLVFPLSSHWLSDLFPKPNAIRSHAFDCTWAVCLFSLWVLIGCLWHLSEFWLAVVTTLVFRFSTRNQNSLYYKLNWDTDSIFFYYLDSSSASWIFPHSKAGVKLR